MHFTSTRRAADMATAERHGNFAPRRSSGRIWRAVYVYGPQHQGSLMGVLRPPGPSAAADLVRHFECAGQ